MSRSASPAHDSTANEELHVVQSPSIPFPAPATPIRPQRSAAKAATSSMKIKQENTDDDDEAMTTASEPDLTNDDTADSWSAGEGETDEAIMAEEDDDASVGIPTEDESPTPPRSARKRKTPAKKSAAAAAALAKASDGEEELAATSSPPAKKKRKTAASAATAKKSGKAKIAAAANGVTSKDFGEQDEIETGILSDSSGLTPAEELSENQEEEQAKPKRKRKTPAKPRKPRAPKPEPVYVIPDVEKKPNSQGYQGRLGYACLNTILRKKKPLPIFCSRTCRWVAYSMKSARQY